MTKRAPEDEADFMLRDPFERAQEMEVNHEALEAAMKRLGVPKDGRPLICTPVLPGWPRYVIDAKADGTCGSCGATVWVSPSSRASSDLWTHIVCAECLRREGVLEEYNRLIREQF